MHYNFAKNIEDTGWWLSNPRFGAPGGQLLYDFPLTEVIHLAILKLLIFLGLNWYMSVNVFFILTFPLTAIVSLYVMRKMGIKIYIALPLSVIYAFIPYHFFRGVNHLFLAGYFTIPFTVLAAYRLTINDPPSNIQTILLGFVIALSGPYYAFFSCFFILTGLLIGLSKGFERKLVYKAGLLLFSLAFFFTLSLLPTILYNQKYGENLNATVRVSADTEVYGLKLIQLLLPIEDHNLSFFNKITKQYLAYGFSTTVNENQYSSLGAISSIGFLILIFWVMFKPAWLKLEDSLKAKLNFLGTLNLVAILLATTGGFSLIISTYLNPTFRSVNRVSIFIAFFALVALGFLLQNIKKAKWALFFAWIILPVALFDQISQGTMRNFLNKPEDYHKLVEYVQQVEESAGENGKIYTLPFGQYPEGNDKKIMKVALLTNTVSFSAGAERWRATSFWQYRVSQMDTKALLENIINEGFTGLLIYAPQYSSEKIAEIEQTLQTSPITSFDNEFRFYNLRKYIEDNALTPNPSNLFYYISGKCLHDYSQETNKLTGFWCVDKAHVVIENKSAEEMNKTLSLVIEYPDTGTKEIKQQIAIPGGNSVIDVGKDPSNSGVFPIPHGQVAWPPNLGYPNFIIREVEILD